MKIKTLAVLSVVAVLATAPSAFAFGGGGKKSSGGDGSIAGFSGGGSVVSSTPSAVAMPGPVSAPEPFAGLAVGLGLLGARLLRRRS